MRVETSNEMRRGRKRGRKSKRKKHIVSIRLIILVMCICASIIAATSLVGSSKNQKNINSSSIVNRIQKISELALLKYNYSTVVTMKDAKKIQDLQLPFTEKSFLIKYDGYVKVGVDLKEVKVDISQNNKKVTIKLKTSKILDHIVDMDNILVYDQKSAVFNKLTLKDMTDEISNEQVRIEKKLILDGYLEEANNNTKILIESILSDMGFESANIVFN